MAVGTVRAAVSDSLTARAALLAARGDVGELRPLYRQHAGSFPVYVRLYCDMALSRADGHYGRMIACIDSLVRHYPRRLGTNGRLALAELKAEGLRQEGRYAEMRDYCRQEEAYFRKKRVEAVRLDILRHYADKGGRLAGDSPRARLLGLADRGLVFNLRQDFGKTAGQLDGYARLTCGLVLGRAFRREAQAVACADSLLRLYADSLDAEQTTLCLKTQAEALIRKGAWHELGDFVRRGVGMQRPHGAPLAYYGRLAAALADCPPFRLERPERDCSVGVTYEWPLTVGLRLNGGPLLPYLLDTGQGRTLVPEAQARMSGMTLLDDTLSIASPAGMLDVCPALAGRIEVGDMVLHNLLVYVVLDSNKVGEPYSRVLGTDDLMRLGMVDFYPEKIVFPQEGRQTAGDGPDLCVSEVNTLRLHAVAGGSDYTFSFDTGCPENVLSGAVFSPSDTDVRNFRLLSAGRYLPVYDLQLGEGKAADHAGLLGVPFLHSFDHLRLDFGRMKMVPGKEREFVRFTVLDYLSDNDPFSLERNVRPLRLMAADEVERDFVDLAVGTGKNRPLEVAETAARLDSVLDGRAPDDAHLTVLEARMTALVALGRYAGAAAVGRKILADRYYSGAAAEAVAKRVGICEAAAACPASSLEAGSDETVLPFETGKDGGSYVPAEMNGKEMLVCVDPSAQWTSISDKTARRLKADRLGKNGEVGLIRELRLGAFTVRDVLCRILPDKDAPVSLGFNVLGLIPQVEFGREGVRLLRRERTDAGAGCSLCFDGRLFVQGETRTEYVSLALTRHGRNSIRKFGEAPVFLGGVSVPAADFVPGDYMVGEARMDGQVSIDYLLTRVPRLVFDFRNMRLVTE